MKRIAGIVLVFACLLLAGNWVVPSWAAQSGEQSAPTAQAPPPAYAPPSPGAPPAEDTPAQLEALAKLKAKAEQDYEAARKVHNAAVTGEYNFHYGKDKPFMPGNIKVQGDGFLQPGAFP